MRVNKIFNSSFFILNFLAVDYGTRKSWLAYSVESFVFGIGTVSTHTLLDILPKIFLDKKIGHIVLWMPYNIDGSMSVHGKRVEKFWKILTQNFPHIPVSYHDERLSSAAAEMGFAEEGIDGDIDMEAARIILTDFLEQKKM